MTTSIQSKLTKQIPPPSFPADTSIAKICQLLIKQAEKEERKQKYAPVREILAILGTGVALSAVFLAPKSAIALKPLITQTPDWNEWKHYNISYLQRALRRLEKQKDVEIFEEDGQQIIQLTENGKRKILKYSIESLSVEKPSHWDNNWRLVLYDIPKREKYLGDLVRQTLRSMGFYAIQESVYIYPYPCFEQIEFLREYYGLGNKVQYMLIAHIENDGAYKTYFHLS